MTTQSPPSIDPAPPATPRSPISIVVVGPDGSGKSTLADALTERLGGADRVTHLHGRARILPRTTAGSTPVLEPHRDQPYRGLLSWLKLAYLFVDAQLTWRIAVPRALRRGMTVLVERGWWDIAVDPRRYRLTGAGRARRLGRLLPRPDLTVILHAPAEDLYARKPELPLPEIERQQAAWQRLMPPARDVLWLDARRPVAELVDEILAMTSATAAAPAFIGLPVGARRPRWWLPRASGREMHRAFDVYHPVTRKSLLGWLVGRAVARTGVLRLLPAAPPPAAFDVIRPLLSQDATVAIAASWRPGRAHAVIMDGRGHPAALVKVLTEQHDRSRLTHEGDLAERLGPILTAPLSSPRLLSRGDCHLMFEAVRWIPSWRPSQLPPEVAAAMGRFYRAGTAEPGGPGFGHGDFVPWNLMKTAEGWSLIDWGDARTDAPAFSDLFHFLLRSSALLGRPAPGAIIEGVHGRGPLAPAITAYAEGAGLPLGSAPGYLEAYLTDHHEWAEEDPDGDPSNELRDHLLRELESVTP